MTDHPKHVKGVQEACSQNTPPAPEKDGVVCTSDDKGKGKSDGGNPPSSSSDDDDDDEKRVNADLLDAWMKRLQILTVVTAFLASMDGELFSLTALNTEIGVTISTTARELVYACLAGALIFHICATILGYIASFALLRHRIIDASGEEGTKVGGIPSSRLGVAQPAQRFSRRIVLEAVLPLHWFMTCLQGPEGLRFPVISGRSSRFSSPPPPLSLVMRCYHTTLCLAAVGFTLAVTGILAYIWAGLLLPVGIFATVCLGIGIGAGLWAIAM